jgi:PAS domain S-box-containing protein
MWQFNLASYLLLASGLMSVITGIFIASKPSFPGKMPMMLMMLMGAEWAIAAGLEAAAPDITSKIFWSQVEYIGSMTGPVFYCYFIWGFLQKKRDGAARFMWMIWIIPLLSIFIAATNQIHSLLWTGFEWENREYNSISYAHGPWFWVAVLYAFILVISGSSLLIKAIVQFPAYFRQQAMYLITGSVLPILTTIIYVTGLSPLGGFDISPIGFLFGGLLFIFGIIRKQMFDLLPIAHHVILENMMAGMLVLDEKLRILDTNPAARDMLQMKDNNQGKNALDHIPVLTNFLEKLPDSGRRRTEIRMEDPERWIEVSYTPILEENKHMEGSLIMLRDITSRKRYENKLTELNLQLSDSEKKLKELNTQKDKLFSVIAHDLKNPFNALLGFSRILHEESSEMDAEEIFKISGHIHKAAQQGYDILLNLLEWSRFQTNRIEFMPEPSSLAELLNRSIQQIDYMLQAKEIRLELIPFTDASIMVDHHMIDTALRNLLSNAIKFSHRNGKIFISVEPRDTFYSISIQDFGVGMSEDELRKIFIMDYLYTSKGTEGEQGSGLGLVLCKDFIEKNGGHIRVVSSSGHGSTFTFSIPKA